MSGMDMYHCKPTPTPEKENIQQLRAFLNKIA